MLGQCRDRYIRHVTTNEVPNLYDARGVLASRFIMVDALRNLARTDVPNRAELIKRNVDLI